MRNIDKFWFFIYYILYSIYRRVIQWKDLSREEVLTYLENNVVDKQGAAKITGQSLNAFTQSVKLNAIKPYFEIKHVNGERPTVRLYHVDDLKEYAKNKRR